MIPVSEPLLSGNEKKYLNDCIDSGWISSDGPYIKKFESSFAQYIGMKHGIAVSNGTAALETALFALGIKEGDEVIMPAFTIISCALAVLRLKAKPVLVDIEPVTWNIDAKKIESKITKNTKAIMPVHIYGHPADMDGILEISNKYGLAVIEDSAEAHGAEYKNKKCGSIGCISAFSFYANKIISAGEGGMVLCNDENLSLRCRDYRNLCYRPERRFLHRELGYNFRMSNLQAAVGLAQLEKIDEFLKIKTEIKNYYKLKLSEIQEITMQTEKEWAKPVFWMCAVLLNEKAKIKADTMINELKKEGIDSRAFFLGLHRQPALNDMGLFNDEQYPETDKAADYGFYLPSGFTLKKEEINFICEKIKLFFFNS